MTEVSGRMPEKLASKTVVSLPSGCLFLSKDWVSRIVDAIVYAKHTDENFKSLAEDFSLSIAYIITDLPQILEEQYQSSEVVIFVELIRGAVNYLDVSAEMPTKDKAEFTIKSSYDVAKKIVQGEVNLVVAFLKRLIRVEPFMKLYLNPAFTAKSIVTANFILAIMRNIPTVFPASSETTFL